MLLKAEAFHNLGRLHKTSRNFILLIILKEPSRFFRFFKYKGFPNQKDNSTTRSFRFFHSSMQYTSVYLQDPTRHSRYSRVPP